MSSDRYAWQIAKRAHPSHSKVTDRFRASRQARSQGRTLTRKALSSSGRRSVSPVRSGRKPGHRSADEGFESSRIAAYAPRSSAMRTIAPKRTAFTSLAERRRANDLATSTSNLAPASYGEDEETPATTSQRRRVAFASSTRGGAPSPVYERVRSARAMYRPGQSPLDLDKLPSVDALLRAVNAKTSSASASGRRSPTSIPATGGTRMSGVNSQKPQQKIRVTMRRPGQYCTYGKFSSMTQRDLQTVGHFTSEKGALPLSFGASITAAGPYVSASDQRRIDDLATKQGWIAGNMVVNDHRATVARRELNDRGNPVRLSGPARDKPHTHSGRRIDKEVFRDYAKQKWMDRKGFKVV